jgi:ABC-type Fe3+-hydroxamate transport system substrate-binding protein
MRVATAGLAACALLVAGTGCGERQEPTGPLVDIYPVTVQGAGEHSAIVKSVPRRIVPLGPGPRQILRALGLQSRTVLVNDSLVGLPLVGVVRRARPDLIVASSNTDPLDLERAQTATHAAVYVQPDSSLDDVVHAIGEIGLATGRPVRARKLTAQIERTRRAIGMRLRGVPTVSVFVDTGDFATVPARSLLGDLVVEAHGRSVAGASPEPGPFPLRRLVQLAPQAYLATADSGTTLAGLRANPATRRLPAVRHKRFGVLPNSAAVAGLNVGAALGAVARLLHPEAFR